MLKFQHLKTLDLLLFPKKKLSICNAQSVFELCRSWDDWEIGKHGIRISYQQYSATYLPEVAFEQGWNHEETIRSLLRKAGNAGGYVTAHIKQQIEVERYQSSKAYMSYAEYASLRGLL